MVGHHIAHRPGVFIVSTASLNADFFGSGNLHMVNIAAVPNRLKDAVGKAEHHDVLHSFLAEVMVNAVNLPFLQDFPYFHIQCTGRFQVMAKGLFDDDPPPVPTFLLCHAGIAELADDLAKKRGRGRQIVAIIVVNGVFAAYRIA